jgi:hypothetical protein
VITGWNIILALKIAVVTVTLLLLASFVPLVYGNSRLHGRINMLFSALTASALLALEVMARLINPHLFDYFDQAMRRALSVHLCFAVPALALLPAMLYTGLSRRRATHLKLACLFGVLWSGTLITGLLLPHTQP